MTFSDFYRNLYELKLVISQTHACRYIGDNGNWTVEKIQTKSIRLKWKNEAATDTITVIHAAVTW